MEVMRRKLVWVERPTFHGWACSECAWLFNSTGPPTGDSLAEMQSHFEEKRDSAFRTHICAEHSATRPKT